MDHYADDLAELMNFLNLKNTIMVGHSTGGGEVARYVGRHGAGRVAKAVLISAVPPLMLKTDNNPGGLPMSAFDDIRTAMVANRPQFYQDLTLPFFGYNRPGAKISKGVQDNFWLEGMLGSHKSQYDTVKAFSETDFTEDLKKIDIPILVLHGEDDQIVPIDAAGRASAKIVKNAKLKTYPGYPHGMPIIHADEITPTCSLSSNPDQAEWVCRLTICSAADPSPQAVTIASAPENEHYWRPSRSSSHSRLPAVPGIS
jgi:non-heme chloroperoxidase